MLHDVKLFLLAKLYNVKKILSRYGTLLTFRGLWGGVHK